MDPSSSSFPCSDNGFQDVTSLFEAAAEDMHADELIFMDGFTLHDAMSAFEIGEPRLDSGLVVEEHSRPRFDPLAPLLPEELCWLLDATFGYEMEWHAGNCLAHTVFTVLHVHHLPDMEFDLDQQLDRNLNCPMELVTLILKSAIQGLLKSCDLGWRKMRSGDIKDAEDWQSDKCDVSLLEGIPVKHILASLTEAARWLSITDKVSGPWKDALRARSLFRHAIVQLLDTQSYDLANQQVLIDEARRHLHDIINGPSVQLTLDSSVPLCIDPYISRRLNNMVPVRVIPIPLPEKTWNRFSSMLDGIEEIDQLSRKHSLLLWQSVGDLRLWEPETPTRSAYVRSWTQTTFYDGLLVLNKFPNSWTVDHFFLETIGTSFSSVTSVIDKHCVSSPSGPYKDAERSLYKLIIPHMRALWSNPPRRRRHIAKSLVEWHTLYDTLTKLSHGCSENLPTGHVVLALPTVALVWRLSCILDIVLSGFQLELYAKVEIPFAYWYVAHVIDTLIPYCEDLLRVVPKDTPPHLEISFQIPWFKALRSITDAIFLATMPLLSDQWGQMRLNFYRRYKWAFRMEYSESETPPVGHPDLIQFMSACSTALQDQDMSPFELIDNAKKSLSEIIASGCTGACTGRWGADRLRFVKRTLDACDRLDEVLSSMEELEGFNHASLRWDPSEHPWFPSPAPR